MGNGGGEAAGYRELLVSEEGGAGSALHGDVSEDHDDPGQFAGLVADGSSAVIDRDFGVVFANQHGVVGYANDCVEALDLGDGSLDRFASALVHDAKDLFQRPILGL